MHKITTVPELLDWFVDQFKSREPLTLINVGMVEVLEYHTEILQSHGYLPVPQDIGAYWTETYGRVATGGPLVRGNAKVIEIVSESMLAMVVYGLETQDEIELEDFFAKAIIALDLVDRIEVQETAGIVRIQSCDCGHYEIAVSFPKRQLDTPPSESVETLGEMRGYMRRRLAAVPRPLDISRIAQRRRRQSK